MGETYLNTETYRLTSIPGERHPNKCQRCGAAAGDPERQTEMELGGKPKKKPKPRTLARFIEHDHHDKPENRLLVLCSYCAAEIVEPAPRLYRELSPNNPWPGCMALCLDCRHRDGVSCKHPAAKANGGPGVMLRIGKPISAMMDGVRGGKRTGWMEVLYLQPASHCREKEVA